MKMTKNDIKQKRAGIDWSGMLKAVLKAVWPFICGAIGGLISGCTVGGIGPNFFGA